MKDELENRAATVILYFWRAKQFHEMKDKKFLQMKSKFDMALVQFKKLTLKFRRRKYLRQQTISRQDIH